MTSVMQYSVDFLLVKKNCISFFTIDTVDRLRENLFKLLVMGFLIKRNQTFTECPLCWVLGDAQINMTGFYTQ